MKLDTQSPKQAVKALRNQRPLVSDRTRFKDNLVRLFTSLEHSENESEEHLKNYLRDFLISTYYQGQHEVNTQGTKDLVIYNGDTTQHSVGVIVEVKRKSNVSEMISKTDVNKKAFWELILYYLDERITKKNFELKHVVITNLYEWFIFDVNTFDKFIHDDTGIVRLYKTKVKDNKDNKFFYKELATLIRESNSQLPCTYFNLLDYRTAIKSSEMDDQGVISLYKLLSPEHLLKKLPSNDSNVLDKKFYNELLYLIGLEEVVENSTPVIRRRERDRRPGALIELAIDAIETKGVYNIPNITTYGRTSQEQVYSIALELTLTWVRDCFKKCVNGVTFITT